MKEKCKLENNGLEPAKVTAWALARSGMPQNEIGRVIGRKERSVRYYISEVNNTLMSRPEWANALLSIELLVPKAVRVLEKYLDGKGKKKGGDLEVAFRILEGVGIVAGPKSKATESINYTAYNAPIQVNPQPDPEFSEEAPKEIKKMIEVMERILHQNNEL